jgi:hypothetical protein
VKGLLVRAGIDNTYGKWNAPIDPGTNDFVYVPIPEGSNMDFHKGMNRSYAEIVPALKHFCRRHSCDISSDLKFPNILLNRFMHLDPDFGELTYGDVGSRRGKRITELSEGDLIVFYAGLRPIRECGYKLIYAIIGMFIVEDILSVSDIPQERWNENAHTRRLVRGSTDIVVRARKDVSGRLARCLPIGEWRMRAYRVRCDILGEWGGLSVNDGYIQRSAVPPLFLDPEQFYTWFLRQNVQLVQDNN